MTTSHPFDAAVALTPVGDGTFDGHTTPEYANMVGPFGGDDGCRNAERRTTTPGTNR